MNSQRIENAFATLAVLIVAVFAITTIEASADTGTPGAAIIATASFTTQGDLPNACSAIQQLKVCDVKRDFTASWSRFEAAMVDASGAVVDLVASSLSYVFLSIGETFARLSLD